MKKIILLILFFVSFLTFATPMLAATKNNDGMIDQINYIKKYIMIDKVSYKLSNTVKVFGFSGNKYLNVKKLTSQMYIKFKYSTKKGVNTISNIWVQPN